MSTRVSLAPENALPNQVKDLRTDVDTLKVNQRVGGLAMVTWYSHKNSTWDYSVAFSSAGGTRYVPVTFTATKQNYVFARLMYRVYSGTTTNEIFPWSSDWPRPVIQPMNADPANPKLVSWSVYISNQSGGANTYYFKWWVLSSDSGSVF